MKNIAVIFGGKSSEHDISIITACNLMQNLDENKFKIFPIYIQKNGKFTYHEKFKNIETFQKETVNGKEVNFFAGNNFLFIKHIIGFKKFVKIDFCFVSLHGLNGEDGAISGLLNLCNIPYSCADILASSVAMDKVATKYVCRALKIKVVNFFTTDKNIYLNNRESIFKKSKKLGYPIIVKPSRLGSSIGITRCENDEDLINALSLAFVLDDKVVIEKALTDFKEYNIAVFKFNNETLLSKIEEPLVHENILSFEDKYLGGSKIKGMENLSRKFPADIEFEHEKTIKNYAEKIYKALDFSGVVRIDFLFKDGKVYLNEINSIPGSFANYLWDFSYSTLLENIIFEREENFNERQKLTFSFESDVLKGGQNIGLKK